MKNKFNKGLAAVVLASNILVGCADSTNAETVVEVGEEYQEETKTGSLIEGTIEEIPIVNPDEEEKTDTLNAIVVADSNVNVRECPNLNSSILGKVYEGNHLDMVGEYENFYMVLYKDKIAYVSKKYSHEDLEVIKYTDVKKLAYVITDTTLYDSPECEVEIKDLPHNEFLEVLDEMNGMYYVHSENEYGYVKKECTEDLRDKVAVVDLSDQHMWLYDNNQVILDSPVITGRPGKETTEGLQEIDHVAWNDTLDGPTWHVKVKVFAPFNKYSEGFHDAWWKDESTFGGDTYLTNGSHGCVNLPSDFALELCDEFNDGDQVLIKR